MLWTYFWLAANEGLKKKMEASRLFVDFSGLLSESIPSFLLPRGK